MSVRWCPSSRKNGETSPNAMRWNIHSRYAAPRIITKAATAATHGLATKAPTSVRNSPTKPLRPGSPADANAKNPNTAT